MRPEVGDVRAGDEHARLGHPTARTCIGRTSCRVHCGTPVFAHAVRRDGRRQAARHRCSCPMMLLSWNDDAVREVALRAVRRHVDCRSARSQRRAHRARSPPALAATSSCSFHAPFAPIVDLRYAVMKPSRSPSSTLRRRSSHGSCGGPSPSCTGAGRSCGSGCPTPPRRARP